MTRKQDIADESIASHPASTITRDDLTLQPAAESTPCTDTLSHSITVFTDMRYCESGMNSQLVTSTVHSDPPEIVTTGYSSMGSANTLSKHGGDQAVLETLCSTPNKNQTHKPLTFQEIPPTAVITHGLEKFLKPGFDISIKSGKESQSEETGVKFCNMKPATSRGQGVTHGDSQQTVFSVANIGMKSALLSASHSNVYQVRPSTRSLSKGEVSPIVKPMVTPPKPSVIPLKTSSTDMTCKLPQISKNAAVSNSSGLPLNFCNISHITPLATSVPAPPTSTTTIKILQDPTAVLPSAVHIASSVLSPVKMVNVSAESQGYVSPMIIGPQSLARTLNIGTFPLINSCENTFSQSPCYSTSGNQKSSVTYMSVSRPIVSIDTSPKGITPSMSIPLALIPRPIVSFTAVHSNPTSGDKLPEGSINTKTALAKSNETTASASSSA